MRILKLHFQLENPAIAKSVLDKKSPIRKITLPEQNFRATRYLPQGLH